MSTSEGHNAPLLGEHIAKIAQWMHVGRKQRLNLENPATPAHVVTGLAEFDNPHRQGMRGLYTTLRDAIRDGMASVKIESHSGANLRIATSIHAAH